MKRFSTETEIVDLVTSFENGTIQRADWHHAEHLTVALYYLTRHDVETATVKMRTGIFDLLRSFSINLDREMPYHETLTVFWIRTVADFLGSRNAGSLIETANELVARFDKHYPLKFYSRELLFSDEARARYIEPDAI
jgi:hypothetical protein